MTRDAPLIETPRLTLRPWREADRAPFAALNSDAETMRHFPATLSRAESDALVDALTARIAENGGWGLMAMERRADGAFLGMTGLNRPRFTAPFTPCLELGWRLLREHEGHGYVTEAARACLDFAFTKLGEPRVHAFTVPANTRSRAVMERLGMTRVQDGDFDHPNLPAGHPLSRHVLYVMERPQ
jgi:RimJ/RimL family protein N-acetyltransferase